MLTAIPAWSACFGFAFDRLRERFRQFSVVFLVVLAVLALIGVPFLLAGRSCDRAAFARRMAISACRVRPRRVLVVAQLAGWVVHRSVHHEPSALELTEKCLRREKLLPIESIGVDPIASTARGGALATRVEGTASRS